MQSYYSNFHGVCWGWGGADSGVVADDVFYTQHPEASNICHHVVNDVSSAM